MVSVDTYFAEKHRTCSQNYRTPCKLYSEGCSSIAFEIAGLLLGEGKEPCLLGFSKQRKMHGVKNYVTLVPVAFDGRVTWARHQVCLCDGKVYDPILPEPVAVEDYSGQMFGTEVPFEMAFSCKELREMITAEKRNKVI